eukprot:NODE_408_length_7975_cov_0.539487.p2 type:complete len:361 gc:universal NODE_408_length_7975_cov_0.539487:7152-6070(-)
MSAARPCFTIMVNFLKIKPEPEVEDKKVDPFKLISRSKFWKSNRGISIPNYKKKDYDVPLTLWISEDVRLRGILEYKYAFKAVTHSVALIETNFPNSFLKKLPNVTVQEIINSIAGLIVIEVVDILKESIYLSEMKMEKGITEFQDVIVQIKNNELVCSCSVYGVFRRVKQKTKYEKLPHFCRHCFFVCQVILKKTGADILDLSCFDLKSFCTVDHFDVFAQESNQQDIKDLIWCPLCEQMILKSALESDKERNECIFHGNIYLKTFMYYKEKKQQIQNRVFLSQFGLFNEQFIQDISDMDPLMIEHWGILSILVEIKDKSTFFNTKSFQNWESYLKQAAPGASEEYYLDVFVSNPQFLK